MLQTTLAGAFSTAFVGDHKTESIVTNEKRRGSLEARPIVIGSGDDDPCRESTGTSSRLHIEETSLLQDAVERATAPNLIEIRKAVKTNERLIRDLLESLQLWFHDFQEPQSANEERFGRMEKLLKEMSADVSGKKIHDRIDAHEQEVKLSFQKMLCTIREDIRLQAISAKKDITPRDPAVSTQNLVPPVALAQIPLVITRNRGDSNGDTEEDSFGNYASDKDPRPSGRSNGRSRGQSDYRSKNTRATRTPQLNLSAQKVRLQRHVDKLVRAGKSRTLAVQLKSLIQKYTVDGSVAARAKAAIEMKDGFWEDSQRTEDIQRTDTEKSKSWFHFLTGRLPVERILEKASFNGMTIVVIVLNAVWLGWSADYEMRESVKHGRRHAGNNSHKPDWFSTVDLFFALAFLTELLIRMLILRLRFFYETSWRYNVFDLVVVVATSVEIFFEGSADSVNAGALRAIRLVRVLRMVRFIRSLSIFTELQQLLVATMNSARTLFWSILCFAFITYLAAISCMEILLSVDTIQDPTLRVRRMYFGSFDASITTIFHTATNGVIWGEITKEIRKEAPLLEVALSAYVLFLLFLLIPVIFGTHAMRVINTQKYEPHVRMERKLEDASTFIEGLRLRCEKLGYTWKSMIDETQMSAIMGDTETEVFLMANDVEIEARDVFPLFDTQDDGIISIKQFIFGCHFLSSGTKAQDSLLLGEQITRTRQDISFQRDQIKTLERLLLSSPRQHYPSDLL